jgi:murein DD-endopeptidase MepM/ murein hydrolase activator NlpD
MKLLQMTRFCNRWGGVELCLWRLLAVVALTLVSVVALGLWGGYMLGARAVQGGQAEADFIASQLERQRSELREVRAKTQSHLDALALRLGEMQARVMRLDALGQRLTEMGKLDAGEFDFDRPPAQGGLEGGAMGESMGADELIQEMGQLERLLEDRERQLGLLGELLMNRNLSEEVRPTGRPIKKGWLSSGYGMRKDPFSGKKAFHHGLDFAGKLGSDVIAVAAGVVTWVGEEGGYGSLVEIDHGDGYVSRYAHNSSILVKPGDTVAKGQIIARMGSSGRSTGPHVHFELLRNGRKVNPSKYLAAN